METKKIGWSILLFGFIVGISDYFGLMGYITGKPTEPLSSWVLTPIFWAVVALIVVGGFLIIFGSRKSPMQIY